MTMLPAMLPQVVAAASMDGRMRIGLVVIDLKRGEFLIRLPAIGSKSVLLEELWYPAVCQLDHIRLGPLVVPGEEELAKSRFLATAAPAIPRW
jgi:hypothetical protein